MFAVYVKNLHVHVIKRNGETPSAVNALLKAHIKTKRRSIVVFFSSIFKQNSTTVGSIWDGVMRKS